MLCCYRQDLNDPQTCFWGIPKFAQATVCRKDLSHPDTSESQKADYRQFLFG
jgi:hypothetical protein